MYAPPAEKGNGGHAMKTLYVILLVFVSTVVSAPGQDSASSQPADDKVVFRDPCTLRLRIDKKHMYVEDFGKIPYVQDGNVYLFAGEEFGLTLDIQNGSVRSVTYQPDVKKADVRLKFTQEKVMMLLVIENHSAEKLFVDALMTVPNKKGIFKTSILPIMPGGMAGYESWPHPIVQLVLRNMRLQQRP